MKYILLLPLALFTTTSFANEQSKEQSVLEFYRANPNHEMSKLIQQVFDEIKPRSKIAIIWRLISGKINYGILLYVRSNLRHACQSIGKELNWDKEKIEKECDKLCAEADRICSSAASTKTNIK